MKRDSVTWIFFRRVLFLGIGGVGFFLLGLIGVKYKMWLKESGTFHIRRIEIQGNELFSEKEVLRLAGLAVRESIWQVDLSKAVEQIRSNAFIEDARVNRCFPDLLHIKIKEKTPVALLTFEGKFYCVDWEGMVLPSKPGKLYDLPVLSGDFRGGVRVGSVAGGHLVQEGLNFLRLVFKHRLKLYCRISEIAVGRPEGMVIYTHRAGIPVWVGKSGYEWKICYLEAILDKLSRNNEFTQVRYIDLRYEGQVVLGMRT